MRPVQRRQQGLQYGMYLLVMQVINYGIDKIPPATLVTVIGQALLFTGFIKVGWNAEDVCISAIKIIKYKDWRSFVMCNFEHGSDMHLYYNMVSFIFKGSYLEPMYKTSNFAILLGILSAGCSGMYVGISYFMTQLTGEWSYYTTCAIGFSSVLFALKIIVAVEEVERFHNVGVWWRPTGHSAVWVELLLINMLVPNTSFVGHLAGILVGWIYCYTFIGSIINNVISTITGKTIRRRY